MDEFLPKIWIGVQVASPDTYVERMYCYLTVLKKQVYAAHGYGL